jgi:hypothetical protein
MFPARYTRLGRCSWLASHKTNYNRLRIAPGRIGRIDRRPIPHCTRTGSWAQSRLPVLDRCQMNYTSWSTQVRTSPYRTDRTRGPSSHYGTRSPHQCISRALDKTHSRYIPRRSLGRSAQGPQTPPTAVKQAQKQSTTGNQSQSSLKSTRSLPPRTVLASYTSYSTCTTPYNHHTARCCTGHISALRNLITHVSSGGSPATTQRKASTNRRSKKPDSQTHDPSASHRPCSPHVSSAAHSISHDGPYRPFAHVVQSALEASSKQLHSPVPAQIPSELQS